MWVIRVSIQELGTVKKSLKKKKMDLNSTCTEIFPQDSEKSDSSSEMRENILLEVDDSKKREEKRRIGRGRVAQSKARDVTKDFVRVFLGSSHGNMSLIGKFYNRPSTMVQTIHIFFDYKG